MFDMREAVIVAATRTAVGKARRGSSVETRAEDLGKAVLEAVIERAPGVSREEMEDIIIGCAMPEGEQGLNFARIMALYAGFPVSVPAITDQPLLLIGTAVDRLRCGADHKRGSGDDHCRRRGKHEPCTDERIQALAAPPHRRGDAGSVHRDGPYGRECRRAVRHLAGGSGRLRPGQPPEGSGGIGQTESSRRRSSRFNRQAAGIGEDGKRLERSFIFEQDEGVRTDTSLEALAQLRPAFKQAARSPQATPRR